MPYDPSNWYWVVGDGPSDQVWSSASASYVSSTDAMYLAWVAAGGIATNILDSAELFDVLASVCPAGIGSGLTNLTAEQYYIQAITAGCPIVSASTPALSGTYGIQDSDLLRCNAEQTSILTKQMFTNGATARGWRDVSGGIHMIPSIAVGTAMFVAIADYVDALETALVIAQSGGGWTTPTLPEQIP